MKNLANPRPRIKRPLETVQFSYAFVPQELILPRPAIRHTQQDDQRLSPFEFTVACAVIVLAWSTRTESRHHEALEAGAEQIKSEKDSDKYFREEDWEEVKQLRRAGRQVAAPQHVHTYNPLVANYKPDKLSKALKRAGQYGYAQARRNLRQKPPPKLIDVETSKRALLLAARLPVTGRNFLRLEAALDRLTAPVIGIRKPLLYSWDRQNGGLQLQVTGSWLKPPYRPVPLPLPLRNSHALALFLFLQAINTSAANSRAMAVTDLCDRIGIASSRHRPRNLDHTLNAVNAHLERIPEDVKEELHRRHDRWLASHYVPICEDGYVRFSARHHHEPEPEAEGRGYESKGQQRLQELVAAADDDESY